MPPAKRFIRVLGLVAMVVATTALALPASAGHTTDPRSKNLIPIADSPEPGSLSAGTGNSDMAFWGTLVFQGSYDGFRIIDISNPKKPKELADITCPGSQGDMSVWGSLLFRSIDSTRTDGSCENESSMAPSPVSFEGIQIFDVSDPVNTGPDDLIASVPTCGGSHTHTLVPDGENERLLIYVTTAGCPLRISMIEVPLDDPAGASVLPTPLILTGAVSCHDIGVFLEANLAVGACTPQAVVWDISDPASPEFLYNINELDQQVTGWHQAALSYDGEVIALGWEPGGGTQPRCQASNTEAEKSIFFYQASDGQFLGSFEFPQDQSDTENCTVHEYNIVPHPDRYVLVSSYYQGGTNVVDFTDPANAFQVAWSDPPPLDPQQPGGAWATYWYNGYIYESDITEGLNIFLLKDPLTAQALRLKRSNPQTQEQLIP